MTSAPEPKKLSITDQISIAMKIAGRIRTENHHLKTIGREKPEDQELLDGMGAIISTLGTVRDNEPEFRGLLRKKVAAEKAKKAAA